jgi:hypothetical protein
MRAEFVVDDINIPENVIFELAMRKGNVQKYIANKKWSKRFTLVEKLRILSLNNC